MQRRAVLQALLYAAAASLCKPVVTAADTGRQLPPFCSLKQDAIDSEQKISRTTGDDILDSQLSAALIDISDVFGVMPGFVIIDEDGTSNAHAKPESLIDNTHGTVLFSRALIFKELRRGGIAVTGIMAHEFGHILQFRSRLYELLTNGQPTQRLAELHADYMAGYYLGVRQLSGPMDIQAFLDSIYINGDTKFNTTRHHGTPSERRDTVLVGYKLGIYGKRDINEVAQHGVNLIRAI